jgi:hypothetical protein
VKPAARLRAVASALLLGMTAVAEAFADETPLRVFGLLAGGKTNAIVDYPTLLSKASLNVKVEHDPELGRPTCPLISAPHPRPT